MFETNLFGVVEVVRRAVPRLRESGGGVVCNVTSCSYLTRCRSTPPTARARRRSARSASRCAQSSPARDPRARGDARADRHRHARGSDRLPEAAAHAGYEALAEALLTGGARWRSMTASPESAARAIADAILDDASPLRVACDSARRGSARGVATHSDEELMRAMIGLT
jgi:hypothetical protein